MKKIPSLVLIDDDELSNSITRLVLEDMDIAGEIVMFSEGSLALDYLQKNTNLISHSTILLIVDLNMPEMNGEEFVKQFNKLSILNRENIRLVIYSAMLPGKEYNYLKSIGVNDFVEKPLTESKLIQLIERIQIADL